MGLFNRPPAEPVFTPARRITRNVPVSGTCPKGHPVTVTRTVGASGDEPCPCCGQLTKVS